MKVPAEIDLIEYVYKDGYRMYSLAVHVGTNKSGSVSYIKLDYIGALPLLMAGVPYETYETIEISDEEGSPNEQR